MKFIFECSTRYLTSECSERAPMYYSIYYINLDQLFQKVNIPKV